jgi:hypothetical protein
MNDNKHDTSPSPLYHDEEAPADNDEGPSINNRRSSAAKIKKEEEQHHQQSSSSRTPPVVASTTSVTSGSREPDINNKEITPSSLDVVEEWSSNATIHGANYVMDRSHLKRWRRRLWLVLMLSMTGVMIWQIDSLVQEYIKYETNTQIGIVVPRSLPFPEVTICNVNSIQKSRVLASGLEGNPVNEEELIAVSQPLEEFIISCSYNHNEDVMELWTPIITSEGLCFRFRTDEGIIRPGLEGGLLVSLYINTNDYYDELSGYSGVAGAGVQVFVAQEGTTQVREVPFDLGMPGTLQYIGVSRSILQRETLKPWSQCYGQAPKFTLPKCRQFCFEYQVREECNCREYSDTTDTSLPFCSDFEACYEKIDDNDENEQCEEEECSLPPCYEELYPTRSSALELLANQTDEDTAETVMVLINYEAIREEKVTEVRAQTYSQLLSNIGGQMGLFMGISVISLIELFGELPPLRLLPRLWGDRRLYGVGSKEG